MEPKEILTASNLKQTKPRLMVLDQIIGKLNVNEERDCLIS